MLSRNKSAYARLLGALGLITFGVSGAHAQVRTQPTPFAIRFDPTSLLAERAQMTLPLWLQGVNVRHYRADIEQMQITVVRFDLRQMKSLAPFIELRVGLAPGVGRALVTSWSETGQQIFRSAPFGSVSETTTDTLRVAIDGADYIELELPKTGERLQTLYASAMRFSQVLQAVDFPPEPVFDSFGNASTHSPAVDQDRVLWNRVHALLDPGPFDLHPEKAERIEFEVSKQPECAILTYELRNALPAIPPLLSCNGVELPSSTLVLPDLADPAWKARPIRGTSFTQMRYSGWIRVQQFIPGASLLQGKNLLDFLQPSSEESSEVRKVELQLRFLKK